uniref:SAM-dependent methyltransferase n=1 Tax=Steinernema glaseri TaxID=37863 RepID=A0A1I7Y5W9_9BILA
MSEGTLRVPVIGNGPGSVPGSLFSTIPFKTPDLRTLDESMSVPYNHVSVLNVQTYTYTREQIHPLVHCATQSLRRYGPPLLVVANAMYYMA